MLSPIQCNDDGYFSSQRHLARGSQIWQRNSPALTLPAAGVIHIPPSRHTDLSLADWTRLSFASGVSGQITTVGFINIVAKNKHDGTTKLYTHMYKNKHNFIYTHLFPLIFLLPFTVFELGFPASLPSPTTTTLY
jgi:hypothetical protein